MKPIKSFLMFWYHFIVGDDWRIAAGVVLGFACNAFLVHEAHLQLWWLTPIGVVGMLAISLLLAARTKK